MGTVEALRHDVEELEAFLETAKQSLTRKLLEMNLRTLRSELGRAEEEAEDEAEEKAAAEKAAAKKKAAEAKRKAEEEEEEEEERAAEEAAKKKKAEEEEKKKKKAEAEAAEKKKAEEEEAAAKKKAEAEKAAEEEGKEEEKHSDPQPSANGEIVTPGGMHITAKAAKALKKLKSGLGRKAKDTAAICTIKKDGKTFDLDDWLDDCDIEEITDELDESSPKYIFYSYSKEMGDGRVKTPLVLLFYSPSKASPKKSMETTRWKNEVSKHFEVIQTLEVRELDDFTQEWFDSVN